MRTVVRLIGCRIFHPISSRGRARIPAALSGVLSVLALTVLAACGGDKPTEPDPVDPKDPAPPAIASVEVSPKTGTLTALEDELTLTAEVYDEAGNRVRGASVSWSSSDEDVLTVSSAGVATAVGNGTAEVTASVAGVSGTSALVVEQVAATVAIEPEAAALSALGAEQAFTVTAKDANDHRIEGVVVQWHSSDPSVATLDAEGMATAKAAGESTITATVGGIQARAELTVTQTAAAVRFRSSPEDGVAGAALNPALQVEIIDEDGSVVSRATDAVTITLEGAPSGAKLSGTRTVNAVNGVASFSGLSIERAAAGYTLVARAGGIEPATSSSFDIAPGPASVLALESERDDVTAGDTLAPLEALVEDMYGNLIEDAKLEVEVSIGSGPTGALLVGTTTLETEAGVATFDDLVLEYAGERYTLRVSAPGLEAAETERFDISAGPAAQFRFMSVPSRAATLKSFEVDLAALDAYGNPAEIGPALFELGESPREGAELGDATHVRTRDGVITYETTIDLPGRGFTLRASVDGLGTIESGPFNVGLEIAQLAAGYEFACALTTSRHAFCWGDPANQYGQLGDGKEESSLLPVPVSGGHTFERIAAGGWHACGLTEDGEAYCWGYNNNGRLGDGTETDRSAPVAVEGGHRFREIMAGSEHSCALTEDGAVYCWGYHARGQVGIPNQASTQIMPVRTAGNHHFVTLTNEGGTRATASHTCAITSDGETYCWGGNNDGQIGNGKTRFDVREPELVVGKHDFTTVTTGGEHSCALTEGGEAYCWGNNEYGQLGNDGEGDRKPEPVKVVGGHTFALISADQHSTCALTVGGEAYCWGQNDTGQLGDGTRKDREIPTAVASEQVFSSIVVGADFTCALTPDHGLYCWGQNDNGEFGNGTTNGSLTPVM